jgi:hypothetical protein
LQQDSSRLSTTEIAFFFERKKEPAQQVVVPSAPKTQKIELFSTILVGLLTTATLVIQLINALTK